MNFLETITDPTPVAGNWIKAGINENLTFVGFSTKVDKNGKTMLLRSFYPTGGDEATSTRTQYESFNLGVRTVNKEEISNYGGFIRSLLHFLDTIVTRKQSVAVINSTLPVLTSYVDDVVPTADQIEAFVAAINPIVAGKRVRYKFVGEEKESTKNPGTMVTVASLKVAYIPYAEAIEEGAEKPVVPVAETKLKFNPASKWDLKKSEVVPDAEGFFTDKQDLTVFG